MNASRKSLLAVLAWIASAFAIAAVLYQLNLATYVRLQREGVKGAGIVSAHEPENHDSVTALYRVEGREYHCQSSFVSEPNPDKRDLHIGDPIRVVYLPSDPSIATLGDPSKLIPKEAVFTALASCVGATVLVFAGRRVGWRNRG
jgi:hypothetical protein